MLFFIQTSRLPPSMHCNLVEHGRCCMQNNKLLIKIHVELENSFMTLHKCDICEFVNQVNGRTMQLPSTTLVL